MLLYKVFSGRRTRVTVQRKIPGHATGERRALSRQCGPNLNDKVCTSALKPARAWWGWEWMMRELRGERVEKGESERNKKRQRGEEGEDRQGCPSFKHAGLNGTDSSDI